MTNSHSFFDDGDPPRWIDRPPGGEPEDRAAARLRGALPLAVPEISWGAVRPAATRDRVRLRLSFALAALLFLSMGVGIGVAGTSYRWFTRKVPRSGAEPIEVAPGASVRRVAARDLAGGPSALDPGAASSAAIPASPSPAPAAREAMPAAVAKPAVRTRATAYREATADVAPAADEAPPPAERADSEAAALAAALTALRRQRDADAALVLVEQSLARHPDGALVPEMVAVRVEALLARGDAAQALAALDVLPTARVPLDRRLRVLRGELRANAGRCDEASVDFTATLRAVPTDAVDERSLHGRASCDAVAHDEATLRADLELYVRQFPDRPFAQEARRRLETP